MRRDEEQTILRRLAGVDEKDTSRLEAFSDGVFAVAITLLVLNIKVPGAGLDNNGLWKELVGQWSSLVAYSISFATIGIMWLNHHRLFKHIKRTDTGLLMINLLLLLIIAFIPVPTALLSEYIGGPGNIAVILYSCTSLVMACCFNGLWQYASHNNRLLGKNVDPRSVDAITRQYLFGPILYIVALVFAWISTPVCVGLLFILALFFALPGHPLSTLPAKRALSEDNGADQEENQA